MDPETTSEGEALISVRVLSALALIFAVAATVLFALGAFSSVIALALAAVFALGALVARSLPRSSAPPA